MPDGATADVPDENLPTFPEGDANSLFDKAAYLDAFGYVFMPSTIVLGAATGSSFSESVEKMIDLIIDLTGNYHSVRTLAIDWANYANVPTDIRSSMKDQLTVAGMYWEGSCFTAFSDHMNNIFDGLLGAHRKMTTVAKTVAGMITLVFDTYASALKFITACVESMSMIVADWPLAIKGFADSLNTLLQESLKTIGGYEAKLAEIEIDAITFPELSADSKTMEAVQDPEDWEVKQAPGS